MVIARTTIRRSATGMERGGYAAQKGPLFTSTIGIDLRGRRGKDEYRGTLVPGVQWGAIMMTNSPKFEEPPCTGLSEETGKSY